MYREEDYDEIRQEILKNEFEYGENPEEHITFWRDHW